MQKLFKISMVGLAALMLFALFAPVAVASGTWKDIYISVVGATGNDCLYTVNTYYSKVIAAFNKWKASPLYAKVKIASAYADCPYPIYASNPAELNNKVWELHRRWPTRHWLFMVHWCKRVHVFWFWHEGDGYLYETSSFSYIYQLNPDFRRQSLTECKRSTFHEIGKRLGLMGNCWVPVCGMYGAQVNIPAGWGLCGWNFFGQWSGCRGEWEGIKGPFYGW